jgi:hypothetical protein
MSSAGAVRRLAASGRHDGDAGGEQQAVPANAALRALQARHQVADQPPLSTQCE